MLWFLTKTSMSVLYRKIVPFHCKNRKDTYAVCVRNSQYVILK